MTPFAGPVTKGGRRPFTCCYFHSCYPFIPIFLEKLPKSFQRLHLKVQSQPDQVFNQAYSTSPFPDPATREKVNMANFKTPKLISALEKTQNPSISRVTIQTHYGLVVEESVDGTLDVRLSEATITKKHTSTSDPKQPGYSYYFWPDYQTSFVWYKIGEAGNPDDEYHVDEDELEERYGKVWFQALAAWVKRYIEAFEREGYHLGSVDGDPPVPTDRAAWELEGVLLAAWLALQPGVDSVEMQDDGGGRILLLEKEGIGETLRRYLGGLGAGDAHA